MRAFVIVLVAALLGTAGAVVLIRLSPELAMGPRPVPSLIFLGEEEARAAAEARGYVMLVRERIPSAELAAGRVLRQRPLPGGPLAQGGVLELTVSSGPPPRELRVPEVKGLPEAAARALIEERGLKVAKVETQQGKGKPGDAAGTKPEAGAKLTEGAELTLVVIEGGERVKVPRLYGADLARARVRLRERGLRLGSVRETTDEENPFDIVIGQRPRAGAEVPPETAVGVTLNRALD